VDKQVCHPKNFDFYTCEHAGTIVSNLCFLLCFYLPHTNMLVVVCRSLRLPCNLRGANFFCVCCVFPFYHLHDVNMADQMHKQQPSPTDVSLVLYTSRTEENYSMWKPVSNIRLQIPHSGQQKTFDHLYKIKNNEKIPDTFCWPPRMHA
jgi:hypothetical protein